MPLNLATDEHSPVLLTINSTDNSIVMTLSNQSAQPQAEVLLQAPYHETGLAFAEKSAWTWAPQARHALPIRRGHQADMGGSTLRYGR